MPSYTVVKGDTLSGIAQKVGLGSNWKALGYTGDPTKLQVGTVLNYGGSGAAPAAAAPSTPSTDTLQPYIDAATSEIAPGYDAAVTTETSAATTEKSSYDTMAANELAQQPLVQQTYANLAAELSDSQKTETTNAAQTGEQNIGAARAGVAAAGEENATGSFAAPVTAAQNTMRNNIAAIANKYNLQQSTLTSEENSSIADLVDKANAYTLQGENAYASAMTDIAKLKIQEKQDILTQAQAAFGDDLEIRKLNEQIANDKAQLALSEKSMSLEEAKFAESTREFNVQYGNANGKRTQDSSGGYQFTGTNGQPITAAQFAKINNISIAQALAGSQNPSDQKFLSDYSDAQTAIGSGAITAEAAKARLKNSYSWMGDITF